MKKRLTAMLLILVMLTSLIPLGAFAAEGTASPAESIFLSQSQVQLQVGQHIALTAVVSPESSAQGAVWASQDPDIATVEHGVITAIRPGNTIVSLKSGAIRALCTVNVAAKTDETPTDDKITVYFSLLGDSVHGNSGAIHTLADGNLTPWVEQTVCTVSKGSMVKDVFLKVAVEKEYTYTINNDGNYLATVNGLSEYTNGSRSGWKYLLNGSYPSLGIAQQQVSQGDTIVLHYTDDYSKDDNSKVDTDAIGAVIRQISKLENVTIAYEKYIQETRKAYEQLKDGEKLAVGNYLLLTEAEVTLVEALINKIPGKITLDCENTIVHALSLYMGLSDAQKKLVENREKLTAAKEALDVLKAPIDRVIEKIAALPEKITLVDEKAIADARTAYGLLSTDEKGFITNYQKLTEAEDQLDRLKAAAVDDLIAAIPDKTASNFEQAVLRARKGYDDLTEKQKTYVKKIAELTAAEKTLDTVKADAVAALIANIPEKITLDDESMVIEVRRAYDALTDVQKARVGNYSVLVAAERKLEMLKLPAVEKIYQQTGDYLAAKETPGVGSIHGEWHVIGLKRSGRGVSSEYYDNVINYVVNHIDSNERLSPYSSTENSRVILALTAMGYDVTNVAGHNLLAGLNKMSYIQMQGINGPIWALIALDSHNYKPVGDVTRDKLIGSILSAQLGDGGWALSGDESEPDVTAMAIQALAPYYSTSTRSAVDRALKYLSRVQRSDGGYGLEGTATCESAAQVVVALTVLDIDPGTDSRFVKNGVSVLDAMCAYAVDGGGFAHISGGTRNTMATEQGYYALTAYFRMKAGGKTSLYDMSDVKIAENHYSITHGGGGTWNTDGETYTIVSDGVFAEFTGVKVDGVLIGKSNYTAKDGSTHVTFKDSYLKTLSLGRHSITVVFESCEVTTKLTITKSDAELARDVEDLIDAIGTVTKNSKAKIEEARNAYDALTSTQKAKVSNYSKLTDAEKAYADLADKITVYFTLLGDTAHGDNGQEHTLADGNLTTWISKTAYTLESPATVLDLFKKAVGGKYSYVNKGNYISSVNGLAEFTNGRNSGWMYTLNGSYPNLGVEEQKLSDGDRVVFHYTDNYVKERGGGTVSENAVEVVEKLIKDIGTITLTTACKSRIDAARTAYDKLTVAEKKQVNNLKTLEAAEAKYAELKKADDQQKANDVIALINKIDKQITLASEKGIRSARTAYNKLTEDQKKLVANYKTLTNAETAIAMLMSTDEDKEKAQAVIDRIEKLGRITLDSEADIRAAREAYDKLTDLQKVLVTNYDLLEAAEKTLAAQKDGKAFENLYKSIGDFLETLGTPEVGSIGGEWMVIGLARSGRMVPEGYYDNVIKYVTENIDANQRLHSSKSTDNARLILALTALGKDVTDVAGHNLLLGLNDLNYLQRQGINGPIWALIALDCGNYHVPDGGDVTREALIRVILDAQLPDGGWTLSGEDADPDMTGMALQALAAYADSSESVQDAVERAVTLLSEMQNSDGGYSSIDGVSSESIAQVIVALTALGIDPDEDARFIKNGISALDALLEFAVDGGFRHIPTGDRDGMATEQGYYALTAYVRLLEKKTPLYIMTDVIDRGGITVLDPTKLLTVKNEPAEKESEENLLWVVILVGGLVCAGAVLLLVVYRKKTTLKEGTES